MQRQAVHLVAEVRGGAKFEQALAEITAKLNKYGTLKVGFLSGAKYSNGTPVALIAAIQNYGAPRAGIPPRPFFSNMVKDKQKEWPGALKLALKASNYDVAAALNVVGEGIKGQLQQSIKDTNSPPLKPATIRRKGFAKPLISTGLLINSATYKVE